MDPITLRPVTDADQPFLHDVYASTRAAELAPLNWPTEQIEAFTRQQYAAQTAHYWAHYDTRRFCVVEWRGQSIGRLFVERRADEIRIVDIALLPEFRNRGIGTRLIGAVLEEGAAAGLPVSIHVEVFNPAQRLYARLGFVPVGGDQVYRLLERSPREVASHA